MRRIHYPGALPAILLAACLIAGCDSVEGVLNEDVTFVVESYQEVGAPIRRVRLSRTGEINQLYSASELAIRGASVRIHLMSQSGTVEESFALTESATQPGVYEPGSNHVVLPLRVYRLEADLPDAAGSLSTETLTPGDFEIVRTGLQEVVYQQEPQFALGLTRSSYPTRQT
ncbi:MAG TPA: DUF4249 domain-containing protein, partial [Rhodothermia bacterium]|nr:DUF4249 domain-containing protein [Rhodothermia bacterium]